MINTIMMANFNSIIKSLLWMMHSDNAILARIEFMVVMVSIITGTMSILDAYQRTSDSSLVKYIISLGNVISDSMFLYTIGLLESVPFSNDLFGVWAALLAVFRYGTNYAALYGLNKEGNIQWNLEIGSAISSFIFIGDLYGARETNFGPSLLFLWALQPLRILYMYLSFQLARRSYWQQYSSVLLSDYMWTENEADSSEESNDPGHTECISRNSTRSSLYSEVHSEGSRSSYYSTTSRNADEMETQNLEFNNLQEVNQRATQSQVTREIEEVELITNEQETDNRNHITSSQPRLEVGIRLKQMVLISSNKQYDPTSMRGYKYLIQGEIWQKVGTSKFGDRIEFKVNNDQKLITLDKIWQSDGRLLVDKKLKDLCLSFALYRLLRCRFDDYALPEISLPKTRKLILHGVLGVNTGQVKDNIMRKNELEVEAKECEMDPEESRRGDREQEMDAKEQDSAPQVGDSASAEPDLSNVQGWQSDRQEAGVQEPAKYFKEEKEELNDEQESPEERVFRITEAELSYLNKYMYSRFPIVFWMEYGFVISIIINIIVIVATIWVMVVLSGYIPPEDNYTRIVHGRNVDIIITWCILIFILLKETWEISLYVFSDWTKIVLISTYVECTLLKHSLMEKLIRFLCNISIARRWHGKIDQYNFLEAFNYKPTVYNLLYYLTLGLFSKATDGVKSHGKIDVSKEVKKAIVKSLHLLELDKGFLPSHMPSVERNNVSVEISRMCQLNTCSQNMNCCCYHEPSLVKQERLDGELRANFIVANSLSRYCAHLLVNKPELMPDDIFVGAEIFRNAVCEACVVLKGCDTLQTMYKRLMKEGQREIMSDEEKTIVRLSAKLGKELIETLEEAARWKLLAEVWADFLVYMAPNSNVDAHKKCLETGGDFITHVWALLSHAGILENTFVNQVEDSDEECLP